MHSSNLISFAILKWNYESGPGGFVKITGHLADEKMVCKKVVIGDNVLLGAESWIMAGAVIEDDVKLGIRSVVSSKQVLKKGKTYVGCPAREISSKK